MKLQINDSGGWRNVMSFDAENEKQVRRLSVTLTCYGNGSVNLRILDEDGNVTAHNVAHHGWKAPAWAKQ